MIPPFAGLAGPGFSPEKNFEKSFEKIWKLIEKVLTFAAAFLNETEATEEAIFDEFT